jgi:hypothetical protein
MALPSNKLVALVFVVMSACSANSAEPVVSSPAHFMLIVTDKEMPSVVIGLDAPTTTAPVTQRYRPGGATYDIEMRRGSTCVNVEVRRTDARNGDLTTAICTPVGTPASVEVKDEGRPVTRVDLVWRSCDHGCGAGSLHASFVSFQRGPRSSVAHCIQWRLSWHMRSPWAYGLLAKRHELDASLDSLAHATRVNVRIARQREWRRGISIEKATFVPSKEARRARV